jgi:TetR/AcrR family transcriptional regulator, transcriptional repressor for nem operon
MCQGESEGIAMKVSREQAEANHELIIEMAGQLFKERGFDGVGVADLMKGAGLTHGGFYGHFKSKDDLVARASERALDRSAAFWSTLLDSSDKPFSEVISRYLDERQLKEPAVSCMFAAVGSDASRRGRDVRKAFTNGIIKLTSLIGKMLPSKSKAKERDRALAVFSQMVGALVLARSVDDPQLAKSILRASKTDLIDRFC